MSKSKIIYSKLSDQDKQKILHTLYIDQQLSFADIALQFDTYSNKLRRDAIKFKIKIRSKSDAQKNALSTGKHSHPTKGKHRSQQTKEKIGSSVMKSWDSLNIEDLENRKLQAKKHWDNMDENTKTQMHKRAMDAVRATSKTGSKLEKFLQKDLLKNGYKVDFHKEQTLVNTRLQIDLFLPTLNIAIEVDGPSHFEAVWGEDSLKRNIKYDKKKEGLILGKGWKLIRIKQKKDFSPSRARVIAVELIQTIKNIDNIKTSKVTIED